LSPPAQVAVRSRPRDWVNNAIRLIEADAHRSADTHLLRYPLPSAWSDNAGIELDLKDETTHITGSLNHRLARSLFLYALCNGWISEDTRVVEASSGSTAVSEAYFAALLGLPFIAVMPASTSASKVALIESQGGRCHFVQRSSDLYAEAERVAKETGTNLWGAFGPLAKMVADGRSGSVVTLLADSGDTYFCDEWLKTQELDTSAPATALTEFERSGHWD
jgi:cysteine synthase